MNGKTATIREVIMLFVALKLIRVVETLSHERPSCTQNPFFELNRTEIIYYSMVRATEYKILTLVYVSYRNAFIGSYICMYTVFVWVSLYNRGIYDISQIYVSISYVEQKL